MLEASYRPTGWLGIMLGSRVYYEITTTALGDEARWERLADSVAAEVRRHAPSAAATSTAQAVPGAGPQGLQAGVVAAPAPAPAPAVTALRGGGGGSVGGGAAPAGITVNSTTVHSVSDNSHGMSSVNYSNNSTNSNSCTTNNNTNNTSFLLM